MKIKRLLIYLLVLGMTIPVWGKVTPAQCWKKSSANFSLTFAGTTAQRDAVPSGVWTFREGDVWWNTTTNTMTVYNGSTWASFTGGGTTLDGAYDFGGNGAGRTIAATDGTVQITNTDNDSTSLLGLTYSGSSTGDGLTITMSVGSGDGIEFENTGTGADIEGTGNLWSVSKVGLGIFKGGLTLNTGGELLVTARDVLFTGASYDVAWDTGADQLIFQDNTILGIGGAHDAAADWTFVGDGTDLLMEAAAANDDWKLGATTNFDITIYGDTASDYVKWDTSEEDLSLNGFDLTLEDDDLLKFGDDDDFTLTSGSTGVLTMATLLTDNTAIVNLGADQDGIDMKWFGATTSTFALWDASADELVLTLADLKISQGSQIEFIDVSDGLTDFTCDLATDNRITWTPTLTNDTASFHLGNATNTSDLAIFGLSASTVLFDASADLVTFVDYDVLYDDETILYFGTGSDWSVYSDTADTLEFDPGAAGDQFKIGTSDTDAADVTWYSDRAGAILFLDEEAASVNFGINATGLDAVFYGDTTAFNMKWDQANDLLTFTGGTAMLEFRGAAVDDHETTLAVVEPTKSNIVTLPDDTGTLAYMAEGGTVNLSGANPIPLTDAVVLWTTTGSDASELPDGTSPGQILTVIIVSDGGAGTITPASVTGCGWATIIFTTVGEGATFMYIDSTIGWTILGTFGVSVQPLITQ